MAIHAAERDGMKKIALSGGVAYNHAIRETIRREVIARGFHLRHQCRLPARGRVRLVRPVRVRGKSPGTEPQLNGRTSSGTVEHFILPEKKKGEQW